MSRKALMHFDREVGRIVFRSPGVTATDMLMFVPVGAETQGKRVKLVPEHWAVGCNLPALG